MGHLLVEPFLWDTHETKNDVDSEKECTNVFKPVNGLVTNVKLYCREVSGGEARVYNNDKHDSIPERK